MTEPNPTLGDYIANRISRMTLGEPPEYAADSIMYVIDDIFRPILKDCLDAGGGYVADNDDVLRAVHALNISLCDHGHIDCIECEV